MKSLDMSGVQEAGSSRSLPAGGYVCKITKVEDVVDKEYLYIEYDIAEGQHKDYYKDLEATKGFWGGKCYRSYKEAALPMFKRFCSAVTKSNTGYIFDGGSQNADETTLKGKLIGIVFGEEEYVKNNGDTGRRLYVSYECDAEKIRQHDYAPAKFKPLSGSNAGEPAANVDLTITAPEGIDDIPFK